MQEENTSRCVDVAEDCDVHGVLATLGGALSCWAPAAQLTGRNGVPFIDRNQITGKFLAVNKSLERQTQGDKTVTLKTFITTIAVANMSNITE
jgi:hypothetical protein